jgi:rhodanese-related sulfurtransferase/glyoxylase-like metal-dependent hydrolase (beta-lactamase superfamily II)
MYFAPLIRQDIGCAAYLIGSTDAGEAAVIDPRIDMVNELIDLAMREGLHIRCIIETHNHADHVSGHHQLAERTGAVIAVHELADVTYPHQSLRDGDVLALGEVHLRVIHTPGHRPEHIAIAAIDTTCSSDPWLVMTGDSLFIGDVARPDLAVPGAEGAQALFYSLHQRLLTLPEGTLVYPSHVAGSMCGRVTNRMTGTSIGFERRSNPALAIASEQDFVRYMTESLPERPPNLGRIVALNKSAEPPNISTPAPLSPAAVQQLQSEGARVLDIRLQEAFTAGHIPGAISIALNGGQFQNRVGALLSPEQALILVAASDEEARRGAVSIAVIGYTNVAGYLAGGMQRWKQEGYAEVPLPQIAPQELAALLKSEAPPLVVDVREPNEWAEGHLEGALHVPLARLAANIHWLDPHSQIVMMCQAGARSTIGASLLRANGFSNVRNATGGINAWRQANLPIVKELALATSTH